MAQNTSGLFYCGKHTVDLAQSHSINESPGNPEFSGASEVHGWALLSICWSGHPVGTQRMRAARYSQHCT